MPIDFKFTKEQELFRKTVRELCEKVVAPKVKEMFKERMVVKDVHEAFAKQGLWGLLIPPEYGGQGADFITFMVAVEEVARADLSGLASFAIAYHSACSLTLAKYAKEKLKEEVLPKIAAAEDR
ncbi:hypothetical protein B6U99_01630 [Candidatus Geothermarchaeota archaeon ex4572_27]|nr:MAG: hypothetical protein B6U99_01630 [Candidatus Geothermarchaeota archaeon ex4572_27]